MGSEQPGAALPRDVAVLVEVVAERMDLGKGLEGGLEFRIGPDGKVRKWRRLDEGGRDAMSRFDNGGEPT